MDYLRKYLTRLKTSGNDKDGCDENLMNGPTIGISPGQVKEDVHYMESRGAIDLSYLRFFADDNSKNTYSILNFDIQNKNINNEKEETHINDNNFSVGGIESFVDIAVFEVPEHCTSRNCDLSKFGVGSLAHFNGISYLNLCQAGRLRLDHAVFNGHHTQLMIPSEGFMPDRIKQYKNSKFSMPKNRHYEVMLANCHEKGRHLHVMGQVVFDLVDGEAAVNNLTATSLTILVSVALTVFGLLTILAIRINWGTRSDFEQEQYGLVPDSDEGGQESSLDPDNGEDEQESPIGSNVSTDNEDEEDIIDDDSDGANPEVVELGFSLRVMRATIV